MDTFRIFLSSPGDVAEERLIARRVIERLQGEFAGRVTIDPVFWEHEPLVASASFQDQLPHPANADAAICVLWSRLGTRLPSSFRKPDGTPYSSGTEFEFEDALSGLRRHGRPALLVYRKTSPPILDADDDAQSLERLQQKKALDAFVRRWFHDETDGTLRAAFHPFADAAQFEELIEVHLRKLIARAFPEAVGAQRTEVATWRHESPFRGLQSFGFEHAPIFFGRTTAISEMLGALRRQEAANHPFLLVIGASGSGKSSAVSSGLLPVLVQPGVIEGVGSWTRVELRPRDRQTGLSALVLDALRRALGPGTSAEHVLSQELAAWSGQRRRIALVIDQLEEAFTDERVDFAEREQFFALLARLNATCAVWTIATLRSDFYPRCVEHAALAALKSGDGQYDLRPPTPAEIGQIIRLPAAAAGLRFESRVDGGESLDEVLRDEAVRSPEALPLLEFALEELYERRAGDGTLTFAAYRDIGGVEGALARRAEFVFGGLAPEVQASLPRVLGRLIAATASGTDSFVRRSAALDEFTDARERSLLHALVDARLCVSELGHDARAGTSIAHEALIRHWPRVRDWLEANRDLLRAHSRLAVSAERWDGEGRRPDLLLASGRPLEEALSVIHAGVEVTTVERALIDASRARARRGRMMRVAAVAGLAALAIAASLAAFIATSQRERALTEASTTRETMGFMVSLFTMADPTKARANEFTVREMLDRGANDVRGQLRDKPAVRSSLMTAMGRAYIGLGLPEPALRVLGEALDARAQPGGGSRAAVTDTRTALAAATFLAGKYEDAEKLYRAALVDARRLGPDGDTLVAANISGLADTMAELGSNTEAEGLYREALALDERLFGVGSIEQAQTMQGLARTLYFDGRYDESERLMHEGLEIRKRRLGPSHWKVADSLNELGALYYQTGRYADAVEAWKGSLAISEQWAGKDHPDVGTVANNIGRSLLVDGKLDEADGYLSRALDLWRRAWPAGHDDLAIPLNSLAMIRLARHDYTGAETMLDEALRICEVRHFWLTDQVLTNLADVYARTDRAPQAEALLARARTLLEKQYPLADMPDEAWRYALQDAVHATADAAEGKYPEARKLLLGALPIVRKRFGGERYYTRDLEQRLARLPH
ncbi:MAG: tetratricopeptide repeat protein [Steroidobacteraceae bacterium]